MPTKALPASIQTLLSASPQTGQNTTAAAIGAGYELGLADVQPVVMQHEEGGPLGRPFAVVGGQVVDLSDYAPPRLGALTPAFVDADSFSTYINTYKSDDTLIFAQLTTGGGSFQAILDYPAPGVASRREHVASFKAEPSPDWADLLKIVGKPMDQDTFAEFVDRKRKLFTTPTPADMLELARGIEGKKDGAFKFGKRTQTGDREVIWQEKTQFSTNSGEPYHIPEIVEMRVKLFLGTDPVDVPFLFRVQVQSGCISFKLEWYRVEDLVREVLTGVVDHIREATELPVLMGTAPAAVD